jgi:hypothetical protein
VGNKYIHNFDIKTFQRERDLDESREIILKWIPDEKAVIAPTQHQ